MATWAPRRLRNLFSCCLAEFTDARRRFTLPARHATVTQINQSLLLRCFRALGPSLKQAAASTHAGRKELFAHKRKIIFPLPPSFWPPRTVPHYKPSMLFSSRRRFLSDTQDTKSRFRRLPVGP